MKCAGDSCKTGVENDYALKEELGRGAFATVWRAVDRRTGEVVVVKRIQYDGNAKERATAALEYELNQRIQHSKHACHAVPCIHACYDTGEEFSIVFDVMEGGSLDGLLKEGHSFSEEDVKTLMRRLMQGIDALHGMGIAHCDIKPANLMLKTPGDLDSLFIIDLGLASDLHRSAWMDAACGTPQYFAPELVRAYTLQTAYGPHVDEWAAGVVMYLLLCGELPFSGKHAGVLFCKILAHTGKLDGKAFSHLSDSAQDFLTHLLQPNPHKRMSAKDALKHPFLAGEKKHGRFGHAIHKKLHRLMHGGLLGSSTRHTATAESTKPCKNQVLTRTLSNHAGARLSQSMSQAH